MNLKQVPHVVIKTGGEKIVKEVEQVKERKNGSRTQNN